MSDGLLCHAPGRLRVSRAHEEGVGSRVAAAQSAFDRGRRALEGGPGRWLRDPARAASVPADAFAVLEAALGRERDAIEDLERAADEHSPTLLTSLADPDVLRLRGDTRLLRLLARVGSPLLAGPAAGPRTAAPVAPVAMRP